MEIEQSAIAGPGTNGSTVRAYNSSTWEKQNILDSGFNVECKVCILSEYSLM